MQARFKPWSVLLVLFFCLLSIGLISTVAIVRREGAKGLFQRKRDAVRRVMPGAQPLVDRFEKTVPQVQGEGK